MYGKMILSRKGERQMLQMYLVLTGLLSPYQKTPVNLEWLHTGVFYFILPDLLTGVFRDKDPTSKFRNNGLRKTA
jgi:hypothetical protein